MGALFHQFVPARQASVGWPHPMKPTRSQPRAGNGRSSLLLISAGLNVVLLAWGLGAARHTSGPAPGAAPPPPALRSEDLQRVTAGGVREAPAPGTNPAGFQWGQLQSEDVRVYMANLRAVHCPERIIRDLACFELERGFEKQQAAVPNPDLFWQPLRVREQARVEIDRQSRRLELEKRALMRELFGAWWNKQAWSLWYTWSEGSIPEMLAGYLSENQILRCISVFLEADHGPMDAEPEEACELCSPAEERARQEAAYQRMAKAFGENLTPAEFDELALRLYVADPEVKLMDIHFISGTETRQFAQIANRYHPFLSKEFFRDLEEAESAEAKFQAEVCALLGEERFAAWERSQDPVYQEMSSFGEQQSLSEDAILKAWRVEQEAEKEFDRLCGQTGLSPEERTAAWAAVRQETETALRTVLGPTAGPAYLKQHPRWLERTPPNSDAIP
jgi:hypothetical protein